jgi:glycosyltransferase involved in cell wall biosynthesis
MAAEKPVAATRVGGASEAIIEGETGFLIESDDDNSLAEKLIWLLENPSKAAEMGKRGCETVKAKFSCEAQLNKTKNVYESLLSK